MFYFELKNGSATNQNGVTSNFNYLSICVTLEGEIVEVDRFNFKSKNRAGLALYQLAMKKDKAFQPFAEVKRDISKKGTEYTYLSIAVPYNGEIIEIGRHFFEGDAALSMINQSLLEDNASESSKGSK